jgi:hypothetical protein
MTSIFLGSVATPCAEIMWPKYSTWETSNSHLDLLAVNWFSWSFYSTCAK